MEESMNSYCGRIIRRLPDAGGYARFLLRGSRMVVEMRVKPGPELPAENQEVIATASLLPHGLLLANRIELVGRNPAAENLRGARALAE